MKNSGLRNITAVLSKVIEVVSWVGTGCLGLASVVLLVLRKEIIEAHEAGYMNLNNITFSNSSAETSKWFIEAIQNGTAFVAFIPYIVLCVLTALIFRNLYHIFKTSNVESPFSEGNIKRIKNIGYYAIAIPICKIVLQVVGFAIMGNANLDISVSLSEVVFGLVALCLAQYFAYGAQLENDVDGLL